MKQLKLDLRSSEPAALTALDELRKYMRLMEPELEFAFGKGGLTLEVSPEEFTKLADPQLDDAVIIDVKAGRGRIVGSNARSLLLAVYRFMRLLGVKFIRPGTDGEIIPQLPLERMTAEYRHIASARHRGICIEGAVSIENVLDTIEWVPKLGFNSYFVQFITPFNFFQRWYGHEWSDTREPERLTRTLLQGFESRIIDAAKHRGLIYHAVGHGWTCEPLGIPGLGWYTEDKTYPKEISAKFALVDGKREIWKGVPLNTNLCYSDPEVQQLMTNAIADYAAAHPQTDVVQFWLADASNNQCECERCSRRRPADHYVEMLNLLDEKLSARGLKTRIVFLIYVDLLWPPETETLKNPERFILMFAPISRMYSQPLYKGEDGEMTPFVRNNLTFPNSPGESVAYLRAWQKALPPCDSFIFDYHFMWDYIREPGSVKHARVLFEDMKHLSELGLNGMVSCQNQRVFFPTGFGMRAMADALWDRELEFDDVRKAYFKEAFGEYADDVSEYLEGLSEVYPSEVLRREVPLESEAVALRFDEAAEYCASSRVKLLLMRNFTGAEQKCLYQSFNVLVMHSELTELNAKMMACAAREDKHGKNRLAAELKASANAFEELMQPQFDMALYLQTLFNRIGLGKRYGAPELED